MCDVTVETVHHIQSSYVMHITEMFLNITYA